MKDQENVYELLLTKFNVLDDTSLMNYDKLLF